VPRSDRPSSGLRAPSTRAPRAPRSRRAQLASSYGREAEEAAAEKLRANGFRILWQNLRIGALELDVVAKKGDLVVVVEVRARGPGSFEKPLASISRTKRRTLLRAVRALWKGRIAKMPEVKRMRIDVAAVTRDEDGTLAIEWIAGALTEDDA
jgi:putative endonuclease